MEVIRTRSQTMERTLKLTFADIRKRLDETVKPGKTYYGVPRGGEIICNMLPAEMIAPRPEDADFILDDLVDSGSTKTKWKAKYQKPFVALWDKQTDKTIADKWLQFPWEETSDRDVQDHMARVIQSFDDINREGLQETPKRYIKFLTEFLSPPEWNCTTFDAEGYDNMIVQTNIPFYSLCEHHLAPFFGHGHIAYIPNKRIVGLSKLARTLETYSRRFQNQERITNQVADFLMNELDPLGVAVVLEAEHLCMAMRGVKKPNTKTRTSKLTGIFEKQAETRSEFLALTT